MATTVAAKTSGANSKERLFESPKNYSVDSHCLTSEFVRYKKSPINLLIN